MSVSLQEVARTVEGCLAGGGKTPNHPASFLAPIHANATLTPLRRVKMVAELGSFGASLRAVAARYGICEKTARRYSGSLTSNLPGLRKQLELRHQWTRTTTWPQNQVETRSWQKL